MGKRITDLVAETAPNLEDEDLLEVSIDPGGTPASRKVTLDSLFDYQRALGEIYVADGSGSQALSADTWTKVTQFTTNGESYNTTPDHTNDKITLSDVGYYLVIVMASFTGTVNVDYSGRVVFNDTAFGCQWSRKIGASNDVGSAVGIGLLNVAAAEDLEMEVKSVGAGGNFDAQELSLIAVRIR
jgi:hypothetical protein